MGVSCTQGKTKKRKESLLVGEVVVCFTLCISFLLAVGKLVFCFIKGSVASNVLY